MEALDASLATFLQWLLKATFQGSLLVCVIMLIKVILRERLPARWHYCFWLILLARLSLPWAPPSRISIYGLIPGSPSAHHTARSMPIAHFDEAEAGSDPSIRGGIADRASVSDHASDSQRGQSGAAGPTAIQLPARTPGSSNGRLPQTNDEPHRVGLFVTRVLPWAWLAGVTVLAGYILIRALGLWRTVRCERPVTDQQILDLLEDCKMQMRVRTLVGVVVTDKIKMPALFGFVRPRILLPQGLIEILGLDELQCVFLHELAHLRRRDICFAWLVCLLQVLHWFNPLIWFAFRRMRADQEMAADALALSTAGPEESRRYGRTIVGLIERFSRPQYLPSLAGIIENPSRVERRVRAIAGFKRDSLGRSPWALALVILVGCVALTDARREKSPEETLSMSGDGTGSWVNYTSGSQITAMADDGDSLWVGSNGGLTKLNKTSGAMTHYNRANSDLPDNMVTSIARDASGNLWIGTQGGLATFDGMHWTTYQPEGVPGMKDSVSDLTIDANDTKWIALSGGLAKFDGVDWVFYTPRTAGLTTTYGFSSICIDTKGNKWLSVNGEGLVKFDGSTWTIYNPENSGIPGVGISSLAADKNGDLWVGCAGWNYPNGLAKFDGVTWTVYNEDNSQLPSNCVRSIAMDTQGNKWIGTYKGPAKFDGVNWTVYDTDHLNLAATDGSHLPDRDVWRVFADADGIIWLGFYGGLARFDGTDWTVYNTGNSPLPDNHITSIALDTHGTRWIGTWGGGLARFDDTRWTVYNDLNSDIPDTGEVVQVFAVDHDGAVWFTAYGSGLVRFDGTTWTTYGVGSSGLPGPPRCAAVDTDGHTWVGTANGLAEFDGTRWTIYRSENSPLPSNDVSAIAVDKDGSKWIGGGAQSLGSIIGARTLGSGPAKSPKGLVKFDGTDWTIYNTDNSGIPSNRVLSLAIDVRGNKWIGTDRGLARFDGTDWTVFAGVVYWLCAAPDGSIWGLECSEGNRTWNLFRVHRDVWTGVGLDNSGLPCSSINSFCMDPEGDLWFGTRAGLARLTDAGPSKISRKPASIAPYPFAMNRIVPQTLRPVALPVPLAQFPRTLNGWTGEDLLVPAATGGYIQTGHPDDHINRRYVHSSTGQWADLCVIYYSSELPRVLLYQPKDSYPPNGWTWDQTDPLRITTRSGRRIDCLVHRFHRSSPTRQEIVVLSFYVLCGRLHAGERDLTDFWPFGRNTLRDPAVYAAQVQVASAQEDSARAAACDMADTILEFLPDSNGGVRAGQREEN
jgi:beta-lactamase regulating signal transducer with metallopeptidase domain/ligand-binding sensor domain-containing protein